MASFHEGARIYNLFPRLVGKMSDWGTHYDRIKELGFDWVYVNPFHYPGFSGSLYAPKDYYEFNPLFIDLSSTVAPMKQLEAAIDEAHKRGLKLIMDLVINHTAKDHPYTKTHPDWYKRDKEGNVESPGAWDNGRWIEWGDLAEIDNESSPDKENLWSYWQELVMFYLDKGFDGFRADAAYGVPDQLWKMLITAAKKENKNATFFAESLGCTQPQTMALAKAGFDYIFNSSKWWDFKEDWLLKQYNSTRELAPSIAFPESHDTPRLATEAQNDLHAIKQRTLFTGLFSSGWMIPVGFEFGFRNKTDVVHTNVEDWESVNYDFTGFIKAINGIRRKYKIFNEDNAIDIVHNDNWANIIVLRKTSHSGKEKALFILNKDHQHNQRIHYANLEHAFDAASISDVKDLTPDNPMEFIPQKGFEYDLQPAEMRVIYAKI